MRHEHKWLSSYHHLGLVGNLYRWIYPFVCECGALKKHDGTILEPTGHRRTAEGDKHGAEES